MAIDTLESCFSKAKDEIVSVLSFRAKQSAWWFLVPCDSDVPSSLAALFGVDLLDFAKLFCKAGLSKKVDTLEFREEQFETRRRR